MTHGALFAGIHGFSLAASWAGIETLWHSEIDEFCNKVGAKHFPQSKSLGDIRNVTRETARPVDIISAGFPCQPWSVAGKRKGKSDDRWLGEEMYRVFGELKPAYVLLENVAGFVSMALDEMLFEMESIGYTSEQFIIPAAGVGASHRRDRLWIIAYTSSINSAIPIQQRGQEPTNYININREAESGTASDSDIIRRQIQVAGKHARIEKSRGPGKKEFAADTNISHEQLLCREYREITQKQSVNSNHSHWRNWPSQSPVCGGNDGIPSGLVRNRIKQLKAYGNSIVPQCAYPLFEAIKSHYHDLLPATR